MAADLAETVPGLTREVFCAVARERRLVVVLNLYGGIDRFLIWVCRNRSTLGATLDSAQVERHDVFSIAYVQL